MKTGNGPAVLLVDGAMGYREYPGHRPLAAELSKVAKLVLFEPPPNLDDEKAKQEFAEFTKRMPELLEANQCGDTVDFFDYIKHSKSISLGVNTNAYLNYL